MNRNRQIRPNKLHQLNPLLRIHRDHQQRHLRGWDSGAAEMHEHEVDVLAGIAFGDFVELWDEEGVAGDVDAVWSWLRRVGERGAYGSTQREETG